MPPFDFKRFSVNHDRSSMRVGTDGVLLGAWAPMPQTPAPRILDIGTGCGLIALMAAQRCPTATITAIDIDSDSCCEARQNAATSPFADRVRVLLTSLQDYVHAADAMADTGPETFDLILCNPPFFDETLLPPDPARAAARHTASLPFDTLAQLSASLLADNGSMAVVMPTTVFDSFVPTAFACGLRLARRLDVRTTDRKPPKRTLAAFRLKPYDLQPVTEVMTLMHNGKRTPDYDLLTRDFYIH